MNIPLPYITLLLFFLLMFSREAVAAGDLKKASFLPQWSPQAQFAGYYTAYEKGFYKKRGLDLEIIPGGPDRPPVDFLKNRKADFVTLWLSTALQNRSRGLKVVNVGQIVQKSALMLIAKKSSGIKTYADLNNKKIGIWEGDFAIQPQAFFRKYHLKVKTVPQSYTVNLFLRGGVDVASAMLYNEYHTLLNAGLDADEMTTFFYYEHGLNFPEEGIYVLESALRKDPDLSCAFVEASIEGWTYAFSHPGEAIDIVLKYMAEAKVPANRAHQTWMLNRMRDLIVPDKNDKEIGILKEADYELVAGELKKLGLLREVPRFPDFYRGCGSRVR